MERAQRVDEGDETVVDIDGMVVLGGELAETVCGVNKGNQEHDGKLQLQQTNQYCKEDHQCDENTKENVPEAHRLPLKGEWTVCVSGQTSNPKGNERTHQMQLLSMWMRAVLEV